MNHMLRHALAWGLLLSLATAAAPCMAQAPGDSVERTLLMNGDTLVVEHPGPDTKVFFSLAPVTATPILSLSRVYPYLKPFTYEVGNFTGRAYWALGIGYQVTSLVSLSIEHAWGYGSIPGKWVLAPKISLR